MLANVWNCHMLINLIRNTRQQTQQKASTVFRLINSCMPAWWQFMMMHFRWIESRMFRLHYQQGVNWRINFRVDVASFGKTNHLCVHFDAIIDRLLETLNVLSIPEQHLPQTCDFEGWVLGWLKDKFEAQYWVIFKLHFKHFTLDVISQVWMFAKKVEGKLLSSNCHYITFRFPR